MKNHYKKFALIGTSCVGKTTLLHKLSKNLQVEYKEKNIAVVPEAARHYFENRNTRNPFKYFHQSRIQSLAKRFEREAEKTNPDIIICDRSVMDAIAYVKTLGTKKETEKLIDNSKKWLNTYTHFFLLDPNGINYKIDHIRKESIEIRNLFHISFLDLLQRLNVPYSLVSGNPRERLKKIKYIIKSNI